jgi:hypothetical protein
MARTAAERMRVMRKRMKAAGLREVRIWVPDTRAPGFAKERLRQSLLLARSPEAEADLDFVEALQAENRDVLEE